MHALSGPGRNLLGVHARLWAPDWSPASAEFAISASAAAGYDFIEIPVDDSADLALTSRLLGEHALGVVVSLALGREDDINSVDPDTTARGERRLRDAVQFARELGARYIGGVTFGAMTKYHQLPSPEARDNSLTILGRVATVAQDYGISLGVEYVNRYESNLLNTAAQTLAYVTDLGAPNVLIHMDTFHAAMEEVSLPAAVADAGGMLGYIHASENHRGLLGSGSTPWPEFFDALVRADYRGPLTFESFSPAVVGEEMVIEIGGWRSLWTDPVATALAANQFLRHHLDTAHTRNQSLASPTP